MMSRNRQSSFTLLEMLVATAITVVLFGSVLPLMLGLLKSACISSVRAAVRNQINTTRGWLVEDIQGTSQTRILVVTGNTGATIAFAMPVYRRQSDAAIPLKSDGVTIDWTDTAVYYLYRTPQGQTQLCRAALDYAYFSALTLAQQQALLNGLASTGTPAAAGVPAANVRYFRTLLTQVDQAAVQFASVDSSIDGYAPAVTRETVPLGTMILSPGTHRLTYRCIGKNALSTGYGLTLDSFIASPASLAQEGEHYLPAAATSGATPVAQNLMLQSAWRNNAVLSFPATGADQSFSIDFNYDTWWESVFNDPTMAFARTQASVLAADGDQVVQTVGNFNSWTADSQVTGSTMPVPLNLHRSNVRVLLNGPANGSQGAGVRIGFRAAGNQALTLVSACIMEQASGFDGKAGTVQALLFSGSPGVTVAAGSESVSDALPLALDPAKNYLVSFYAQNASGSTAAKQWSSADNLTAIFGNTDINLTAMPSWSGQALELTPQIVGVSRAIVLYPATAFFTSQIVDTHVMTAAFDKLLWHADLPSGTGLSLKVRAGNRADLSDAAAWTTLAAHAAVNTQQSLAGLFGRYVQFQAAFTASSPYNATASLRDVKITWPGTRQLVQFSADLAKGPDRGRFQFLVDNEAPRPAWLRLSFVAGRSYLGVKYAGTVDLQLQPRNN